MYQKDKKTPWLIEKTSIKNLTADVLVLFLYIYVFGVFVDFSPRLSLPRRPDATSVVDGV